MYKSVKDLTREQLTELKEHYYMEKLEEAENRTPSYGELAMIDELVSDDEVFEEYGHISFVNDDFFCTAGQEE